MRLNLKRRASDGRGGRTKFHLCLATSWSANKHHRKLSAGSPNTKDVAHNVSNLALSLLNLSSELFPRKPKNARVKRALDAHAPKEVEDARTAVFVKGTHSGVLLSGLMKDLVRIGMLKRVIRY